MVHLINRPLSRRTVLRGMGACLALPCLEAMLPRSLSAAEHPRTEKPQRILFIYTPNGYEQSSLMPTEYKPGLQPILLTPTLAPLKDVSSDITFITGLDRKFAPGTGVHAQCGSCWLTSSAPTEPRDGGFPTNISLDQLIARTIGADSLLPSLELSCNDHPGNKETHYFENISWYGPGYAASTEKNPRAVFQRLFGHEQGTGKSVLDALNQNAKRLRATLGSTDQARLDEYLESIRATERRVQRATTLNATQARPSMVEPSGIPEKRGDYLRLMAELVTLAFQQDRTRVASLLVDPERWDMPRQYHDVFDKPQNHHSLTHTQGEDARKNLALIDRFHVSFYAEVVARLKKTNDAQGSLLDSTTVIMGSGLSDGRPHDYSNLQVLLAGGRWKTRGHLHYEKERPLADLWLTIAQNFGLKQDRFADSTGILRDFR